MVDVVGKNVIKANVVSGGTPISGNIIKTTKKVKAGVSTIPSATTEQKGIIRIATLEEAIEGGDNTTAVTPYVLNKLTTYIHEQGIASDVWVIEHNLNKKPSVTVVDTAEEEQIPDRKVYNNKNVVTLYFLSEFAGKAFLN